jgi:hypothetical protein
MKKMKNLKIFSFLIAMTLILGSCEKEVIGDVFDSSQTNANSQLVSFERTSADFPVLLGSGSGTYDAMVEVSTISNVDRVFDVTVLTTESTASPTFYTVGNSVTIPAGSYEGVLTVTGNEVPSLTTSATTIVLELSDNDNVLFTDQKTTINIFLVCPVPDDYLIGDFDIINLVQATGPAFGRRNFKGASNTDPTLVTLTEGATSTTREFRAQLLAGAAARTAALVTLSLVCDQINIVGSYNLGFNPDGAGRVLFFEPTASPSSYDDSDPTQVIVQYLENPQDAYAPTSGEALFLLQKR